MKQVESKSPKKGSVQDLAATLESLLQRSQESAERLSNLVEQSERAGDVLRQQQASGEEASAEELDQLRVRAEQLDAARAVAEAADRAKSCFLAAMSRELRTPVDGLSRMIELLRRTDLDEQQQHYVTTAGHAVCALLGLLDGALALSKVDATILGLRTSDFDPRAVTAETVELAMPVARRAGVQLSHDVNTEVPTLLRGEAGRLRQVLLYAIRRALQIGAGGPMSLGVDMRSATDSVTTLSFSVSQSGVGVLDDAMERAFAPAAHLDGSSTTPRGREGMGLTIARRLAELMGGRIELDHYDGGGFAIVITVPLDNYRQPSEDRRAHGRLPQELLQSNLGPVVDLSMTGMRVQSRKALSGHVSVQLDDIEGPVEVEAQVMWRRRLGLWKYEIGLFFPRVPPETARQLSRVSLNHRLRRLMGM